MADRADRLSLLDKAFTAPTAQVAALRERLDAGMADRDEIEGVIAWRSYDSPAALALWRPLLDSGAALDPRTLEALLFATVAEDDLDAADAIAARLAAEAPESVAAIRHRARRHDVAGEGDAALVLWRRLAALTEDAEATRRLSREMDVEAPDAPPAPTGGHPARRDAVERLTRARDFAAAAAILPRITAFEPDFARDLSMRLIGEDDPEGATSLLAHWPLGSGPDIFLGNVRARGLALEEEGAAQAARYFRAVLLVDPGEAGARSGLNRMIRAPLTAFREALQRGDLAEVEAKAAGVLDLDPNQRDALFGTGRAFLIAGQPARAAEYFARCDLAADPVALRQYAIACERAGDLAAAAGSYARLLAAGEANEDVAAALTSVRRALRREATLAFRAGDLDAAWDHLEAGGADEESIALRELIRRAGYLRMRQAFSDSDERAEALAVAHVARHPDDAQGIERLALHVLAGRRYAEAYPLWLRLTQARSNARDHLQAARCAEWLRLPDEAVRLAEAAVAIDPEMAAARDLVARVGNRAERRDREPL